MASRFWHAQPASAIADNGSGKCRVTVASTTGMTTGDSRLFFSFTGTTGLNGSQTVTVISGTTLDVSAVNFVATGTGSINGLWDTTNANNWVSTSGGTDYGQTVPGSSDTVTFDGVSGGGTVTVNFGGTITLQSLSCGAFTSGTLDFSINNNSVTLTASANQLSCSGSSIRTFKMGSGTWSITNTTGNTTPVNIGGTNLTLLASSATIQITSSTVSTRSNTLSFGSGLTFGTIILLGGNGYFIYSATGTNTINSFQIAAPNFLTIGSGLTINVTSISATGGSSSNQVGIASNSTGVLATISSASNSSLTYVSIRDLTFSGGGTFTATNSINAGNNTGISITGGSSGGGSVGVIGS